VPSCDGDDRNIVDSEVLYRRLSRENPDQYAVDLETGERWPTSTAFKPKRGEDGLSVYRRSKLAEDGLDASDVAVRAEHIVFGVTVGDVRSLKLGVRDDEWPPDIPDPDHPRNRSHALVVGWDDMSRGEINRCAKKLTRLPSMELAYHR
jgi:hypothetical protein